MLFSALCQWCLLCLLCCVLVLLLLRAACAFRLFFIVFCLFVCCSFVFVFVGLLACILFFDAEQVKPEMHALLVH